MATIKSIHQARALAEARKVLQASFTPSSPIWRRHIRNSGHTGFTRAVYGVKGWAYYAHHPLFWAKIATAYEDRRRPA